jgi:hypothetical protein
VVHKSTFRPKSSISKETQTLQLRCKIHDEDEDIIIGRKITSYLDPNFADYLFARAPLSHKYVLVFKSANSLIQDISTIQPQTIYSIQMIPTKMTETSNYDLNSLLPPKLLSDPGSPSRKTDKYQILLIDRICINQEEAEIKTDKSNSGITSIVMPKNNCLTWCMSGSYD